MSPLLSEAYSFGQDAALELFFKEAAARSLTQVAAGLRGAIKPLSEVTRPIPHIAHYNRPPVPEGFFGKNRAAQRFMQKRDDSHFVHAVPNPQYSEFTGKLQPFR
jgi:hypothetical protein